MEKENSVWNVPSYNENFVGRREELDEIYRRLQQSTNTSAKVCVCGLPGIGKSQIAKRFAYENSHHYLLIWWFNAETQLQDGYIQLAKKLDINTQALSFDQILQAVKEILARKSNWLLIFDNIEDIESCKDYLPEQPYGKNGHIIMTTRHSTVWPRAIRLGPLTLDEAINYLLNVTEQNSKHDAEILAKRLGCFPLALSYAASYIQAHQVTMDEYLKAYNESQPEIFNFQSSKSTELHTDFYRKTVRTTFALTYEKIKENFLAVDLLFFCGFLNPDSIPNFLLENFLQFKNTTLTSVIEILGRYAILQRDKCSVEKYGNFTYKNSYSLHRLVQEFIVEQINDNENKKKWVTLCLKLTYQNFNPKKDNQELWLRAANLIMHLESVLGWAEKFNPSEEKVLLRNATTDALDYASKCDLILIAEKNFLRLKNFHIPYLNHHDESDQLFYASFLDKWVKMYIAKRATKDEFHEIIQIIKKSFDNDEWAIVESFHIPEELSYSLALALLESDNLDESEELLKAALILAYEDGDQGKELDCLCNLGTIYQRKNIYGMALEYFSYALAIHKKSDHKYPDMGYVYNAIGTIYKDPESEFYDLNKSEETFLLSLEEYKRFPNSGKALRYAAWAHYGLAMMYCQKNMKDQAEYHCQKFKTEIDRMFADKGWPKFYQGDIAKLRTNINCIITAKAELVDIAPIRIKQISVQNIQTILKYLIKLKAKLDELLPGLRSLVPIYPQYDNWIEQQEKIIVNIKQTIEQSNINNTLATNYSSLCNYVIANIDTLRFRLDYMFGKTYVVKSINEQLDKLVNEGLAIIQTFSDPINPLKNIDFEKEAVRYKEQCKLDESANFINFLTEISQYAQVNHYSSKNIFISYAWPLEDMHREKWTKHFVWLLTKHLITAGLKVYTDQLQSGAGNSLHGFMNQKIENADNIIVICDRTMRYKFMEDGFSGVCYEYLRYTDCYRRSRKPRFIIPVCLNEEGNIPGLAGLFAEVSVYKEGYINALKALIKNIYGFGQEFEIWWQENIFIVNNLPRNSYSEVLENVPKIISQQNIGLKAINLKPKKALKDEEKLKALLAEKIPKELSLGKARDQGDCFFDALAQCLNNINNTDVTTDKYLRNECHDFYGKNKELVDAWNVSEFGSIDNRNDEYHFIQYTADECEKYFRGRSPIWGRPNIEGKILCRQLHLEAICVIEILEDPETKQPIISFHLANKDIYKNISEEEAQTWLKKPKIPAIVVEQNSLHFVPLLINYQINQKSLTTQLIEHSQIFTPVNLLVENELAVQNPNNDNYENNNLNTTYRM